MYYIDHDMYVQIHNVSVDKRSRVTNDTLYELPAWKVPIASFDRDPRARLNGDMFRPCDIEAAIEAHNVLSDIKDVCRKLTLHPGEDERAIPATGLLLVDLRRVSSPVTVEEEGTDLTTIIISFR